MARLLVFALGLALLATIAFKAIGPAAPASAGPGGKAPRTLQEVRTKAKQIEDDQRERADQTMKRSDE